MSQSISPLRKAVISLSVVAASFAFVAGGATAAHAEMDPSNMPIQAETDWVPGTGWAGTTGGTVGWIANQFSDDGHDWLGNDIYTRNNGYPSSVSDAELLRSNLGYHSCAPGTSGQVLCH